MSTFGPVTPSDLKPTTQPRRATFFGTAYHKVSGRNQVAIPRHLMKALEEAQEGQLLLMRLSEEGYLRLYTQKQLDEKIDEIRNRSELDRKTRSELIRHLASNAVPVEPDTQGRFVLPSRWVEELKLQEEVAFCGAFSWIEIWPAHARRDKEQTSQGETAAPAQLIAEILDA